MGRVRADLSSRAKPILKSLLKDNHLIVFCKRAIYILTIPKDSRSLENLLKYTHIDYWPQKYLTQWVLYRSYESGSACVYFYNYKNAYFRQQVAYHADIIKVSKKELLKRFL